MCMDAIKLGIAELDKSGKYPEDNVLPENGLQRYLYHPDKQHGNKKIRVTDFILSKNTYRLDLTVEESDNRILYNLQKACT